MMKEVCNVEVVLFCFVSWKKPHPSIKSNLCQSTGRRSGQLRASLKPEEHLTAELLEDEDTDTGVCGLIENIKYLGLHQTKVCFNHSPTQWQ